MDETNLSDQGLNTYLEGIRFVKFYASVERSEKTYHKELSQVPFTSNILNIAQELIDLGTK